MNEPTDKQTTGWQPVATVPEDGTEFWYLSRGRVLLGSLGHDMGGSIKRDPHMSAWHPKRYGDLPPFPPDHWSRP